LPHHLRLGYSYCDSNNQVEQVKDMQPSRQLSQPWTAVLVTCVLVALCGTGILDAVDGGNHPGKHPHGVIRPYPTEAVIWTCGIMTIETVILYCILRPNTFVHRPRRMFVALAVFVPLWITEGFFSLATDLPRYCYSNALFLTYLVLFLGLLSIISLPHDFGRRHATRPHQSPDVTKP
jgi:hypothetical protein